jgi:hypothetical protein
MKAFIDKVFKMKKLKKEAIQNEELNTNVKEQATEAAVEAIIETVKQETQKEVYSKPGHYFADCNCFKCVRWRNQNA